VIGAIARFGFIEGSPPPCGFEVCALATPAAKKIPIASQVFMFTPRCYAQVEKSGGAQLLPRPEIRKQSSHS
jgi:hypothetical protein